MSLAIFCSVVGIAVDWIGDKLYWTDYSNKKVNVMDFSGENVAQLLEVTSFNPTAIVVDPLNRYVYTYNCHLFFQRVYTCTITAT